MTYYGRGLERDGLLTSWQPLSARHPDPGPDASWLLIWKLTSVLGDRYLAFLGQTPFE